MTAFPEGFSRKTKAEILAEYEKLANQLEEAKSGARFVHEPGNQELLARAVGHTPAAVQPVIDQLRITVNEAINKIAEALLAQVSRISELNETAVVAKKNLEMHHQVRIAADTLGNLVTEYESKKQQFATEEKLRRQELEDELTGTRRQEERQREQADYEIRLKRQREQEQWQHEMKSKEGELEARQRRLADQEKEITNLREQVAQIPAMVAKQVEQREKEIRQRLQAEYDIKHAQAQQEWQAAKQVYELRIENLETAVKQQQIEIANLKREEERAAKQAHDLAVAVVKSGRIETMPERPGTVA